MQKDPSKVSEALPFTSSPDYLDGALRLLRRRLPCATTPPGPKGRRGIHILLVSCSASPRTPLTRLRHVLHLFAGTLVGDVGFDPARLVTLLSDVDSGPLPLGSLKWKREAELQHGRVAQLAFLGALFPNIYHFTSDATHDFDELNPLVALEKAPQWGFVQMAMFVGAFEYQRYRKCIVGDNAAGDVGLGQGGFNPFGFDYTEEEFAEKQLQEIKHCRLAMVGLLASYFNDFDFTLAKFTQPDYVAKAGYYFPDGL